MNAMQGEIEMDGRGSGWLRAVAIVVLVLVVGGIGYSLGMGNAGVAAGAPAVVYAPWGFGFGFFGLLFPLLIIGLLFAAFGGRRRGRGGWGGPGGYGGYGGGPRGEGPWRDAAGRTDVPPMFEPMLESWHRRAHGEPAGTTGPDTTARPEG
jgi:hypothetical protein